MNTLTAKQSSESLADLVRQMMTTEAPRTKVAPKLEFHAAPEPDFPALPVASQTPDSYWRTAVPAAAVSVLSYLVLFAF